MQFVAVVFLILSGLGMVVPVKAIYWITLLYQPKDYMVVGRLDFILIALAFNTAVCTMFFAAIRWSIRKLIGSKPD
jgi:hypothetical protein